MATTVSDLESPTPGAFSVPAMRRSPDDPFVLGVGAGDATPRSAILWTRLLRRHPAHQSAAVVRWQLSTDPAFEQVVRSGTVMAYPQFDHSVRVEATWLEPATTYYYRFTAGPFISDTGVLRTLPDVHETPDRLRVAIVSDSLDDAAVRGLWRCGADFVVSPDGSGERGANDLWGQALRVHYTRRRLHPEVQALHASVVVFPAQGAGAAGDAWCENNPTRRRLRGGPDAASTVRELRWGALAVIRRDGGQRDVDPRARWTIDVARCGDPQQGIVLRCSGAGNEPVGVKLTMPARGWLLLGVDAQGWSARRFSAPGGGREVAAPGRGEPARG